MKNYPAFRIVAGTVLGFLLLLLMSISTLNTSPAEGVIEKQFTLEKGARETIELTVEYPGPLHATAEWAPAEASMALILFGPGQFNYYRRSDGQSPLELSFTLDERDTLDGNAWRLKLINQSEETVSGLLRITYPLKEETATELIQ